jgi:Ser/Thr protein kinase RdoA (MazF antagonist)
MATGSKINAWEWDIRVRERNVRKGIFDEKEIEKHLAALPDVADQADGVTAPQPALGGRSD